MVALSITFLFLLASGLFAQGAKQWNVGDKVEILNLTKEWVPGTIIGTVDWGGKLMYRVQLDDPNASTVYFNHTPAADIRSRGDQNGGDPRPGVRPVDDPAPNPGNGAGGGKVDVYYNATMGKNRGVITETKGNKVKIHYPGCTPVWDEWVDRGLIHAAATISATAAPISFLFARWTLTKVGLSATATAWGKAEGIEINADRTYIWYQGGARAPVRGSWVTDARVPGADSGTQFFDGVLIKDALGQEWKVFKWSVKGYPDGIEVQRMCSGEVIVGSRSR